MLSDSAPQAGPAAGAPAGIDKDCPARPHDGAGPWSPKVTDDQDPAAVPDELLGKYATYQEAFARIYHEISKPLSPRRFLLVCKTLGLERFGSVLAGNPRLRAAVYDYALFSDRRKGRTLLDQWLDDLDARDAPPASPVRKHLAQALADSRFSVFDVDAIEPGTGLHVRDVLSARGTFVMDRRMSASWASGQRFGARLLSLPAFGMFSGEPVEAAVQPGEDFRGGVLPAGDQAKLQAAIIEAFAEAIRQQ